MNDARKGNQLGWGAGDNDCQKMRKGNADMLALNSRSPPSGCGALLLHI